MDTDGIIGFFQELTQVSVNTPTFGALVALASVAVLLVFSALCSASEIAFFSLSPTHLQELEEEKSVADSRVLRLLAQKDQLLATILISNNFVNVTVIMLCNYFFLTVFEFHSYLAEFMVLTVILTFILLLFGEIIPKIFATEKALTVCRFTSPLLLGASRCFGPFVRILVSSTSLINERFQHKHHNIGVEELSQALELTDKHEIEGESNILESIIRFGGETASEVMTSRMDMVFLDIKASYKEVLTCIIENSYSRIPVCQGSVDQIKGILYIKDLLPHLSKGASFRWQSLVRPAFFVPETKKIDDLLHDFQVGKVHIAIVVDEFGGTSGLVTMEDVIEEIVGEIRDEYDEEEKSYIHLEDGSWIFQAKTSLADFLRITDLDEDTFDEVSGEADSLAGLLLELKGDFPKVGEVLTYAAFSFRVLSVDRRRILKVKVTINKEETDPGNAAE